jgi:hypothetical protein
MKPILSEADLAERWGVSAGRVREIITGGIEVRVADTGTEMRRVYLRCLNFSSGASLLPSSKGPKEYRARLVDVESFEDAASCPWLAEPIRVAENERRRAGEAVAAKPGRGKGASKYVGELAELAKGPKHMRC